METIIDNITYHLNANQNNATVIKPATQYVGALSIPKQIVHNDVSYCVEYIEAFAFSDCSLLTSVSFPDSIVKIGQFAFSNCSSLTSITNISARFIDCCAFENCRNLISVKINLDEIPKGYDQNFGRQVQEYIIGERVIRIQPDAFWYSNKLKSFKVVSSNTIYCSIDGVLFNKDATLLIKYPQGAISKIYTIPKSVVFIGESAFKECTNLTSIVIPESVVTIGKFAFKSCYNLTEVNLPDSIININDGAFLRCTSITSFNIPNSVQNIGKAAFNCCNSMNLIKIGNGIHEINEATFSDCESLTSIDIPNNIIIISPGAFIRCTKLKQITLGDSITTIGHSAFKHCKSLEQIIVPMEKKLHFKKILASEGVNEIIIGQ